MKKLVFFLVLLSFIFTVKAGYVVRGVFLSTEPNGLTNYTLTFDGSGNHVSAGSMHSTLGGGSGKNSIVIVHADPSLGDFIFPVIFPGDYDIEVRDFHYIASTNNYALCGFRKTTYGGFAFVAVIDGNFTTMVYNEYTDAEIFYSIWADNPISPIYPQFDFYVCGSKDDKGVIASIDRATLQIMRFVKTDIPWVYHKIIAKQNADNSLNFVASGRNLLCDSIGFTVVNRQLTTSRNYSWEQATESESNCVVSENLLLDNSIILASSYKQIATMYPVTFPLSPSAQISAYRFFPHHVRDIRIYVQDIGTILVNNNISISLAGYAGGNVFVQSSAWLGNIMGLSSTSNVQNNHYYGAVDSKYKHYKVRYNNGETYTGGNFQDDLTMSFLFGSPLKIAPTCDYIYTSPIIVDFHTWSSFGISQHLPSIHPVDTFYHDDAFILFYEHCEILKGKSSPEYAMLLPERESEITNFYDRITVKDKPSGTNYQIYTVTGQLIQTGTTNPEINTANLSKGMYILRLETGKAVKFVK